ncbi:MAG: hypothetical protein MASP_01805 [Candidatus Methanolliviera sp. GoM_asphalt]|nr:MAG: hypothetical protein MASP_01805 [Candidatus Methanolliviera sp. GoM_asphalt]
MEMRKTTEMIVILTFDDAVVGFNPIEWRQENEMGGVK